MGQYEDNDDAVRRRMLERERHERQAREKKALEAMWQFIGRYQEFNDAIRKGDRKRAEEILVRERMIRGESGFA